MKPQDMNRAIEFHDSELSAVEQVGSSVVLMFSAVYVHESDGTPGVDAGTGWYQPATFTIARGEISPPAAATGELSDGSVRAQDYHHENGVDLPGPLAGPVELSLVFATGETVIVRGDSLEIQLAGEPTVVEKFSP